MDSLKSHIEGPIWDQTLTSSGLLKKEEKLTKGELYRACVILLELVKLKRGTHLSGWGKKLKEVGQVFENPLWHLLSPLNMELVCAWSYSCVIHLSMIHTNSMCCHTFSSSRRVLLLSSHYIFGTHRVNASKSVVVPHYV
jgi:hypothetical protein